MPHSCRVTNSLYFASQGKLPGFQNHISFFDRYETVFSSFATGSQATSSGSVLGKRKKFTRPHDRQSAVEYLVDCKLEAFELYKYSKALEDPSVLQPFIAYENHEDRMTFIKICAVSSKGLFGKYSI